MSNKEGGSWQKRIFSPQECNNISIILGDVLSQNQKILGIYHNRKGLWYMPKISWLRLQFYWALDTKILELTMTFESKPWEKEVRFFLLEKSKIEPKISWPGLSYILFQSPSSRVEIDFLESWKWGVIVRENKHQ